MRLILEEKLEISPLPISGQCCVSYRNQSFFFLCKTNDWFLYETQHFIKMGLYDAENLMKASVLIPL